MCLKIKLQFGERGLGLLPQPGFKLGSGGGEVVDPLRQAFEFHRARVQAIGESRDLVIVAMGSVAVEAAAAAASLLERRVPAALAIVSSFNPDADDDLAGKLAGVPHVITVEAQAISGGLGSFVSSVVASRGLGCRVVSLAVRSSHDGTSGSQRNRCRLHGVDRDSIVAAALELLPQKARTS